MKVERKPKKMECFYLHAYQHAFIRRYSKKVRMTHGEIVREALDIYMRRLGMLNNEKKDVK